MAKRGEPLGKRKLGETEPLGQLGITISLTEVRDLVWKIIWADAISQMFSKKFFYNLEPEIYKRRSTWHGVLTFRRVVLTCSERSTWHRTITFSNPQHLLPV